MIPLMSETQNPLRLRKRHGSGTRKDVTSADGMKLVQAQAVAEAFTLRRPELEDFFRTNLAALERELDDLDQALQGASAAIGATPLHKSC